MYLTLSMKEGLMQVAVDAAVFTIINGELNLLLIKRKNKPFQGKCALPGGFVEKGEEFEDAVTRELCEETSVSNVFLKQLGAYGGVKRDPRGRVIAIAYLALISADQELHATSDAMDAKWYPTHSLPALAFDHAQIVSNALETLRYEIQTTNIALQILPKKFTLSALQSLYESVLDKKLDKRNFRKRIKEFDLLKETNESFCEGAHRPAKLYVFKQQAYTTIREKIHVFLS